MTTPCSFSIQDQCQQIVAQYKQNDPTLVQAINKILGYVKAEGFSSTRSTRKDAEKAIFNYLDKNKKFSKVLDEPMNTIALGEYRTYKKLLETFLDDLKKSSADFDLCERINKISKQVHGNLGVFNLLNAPATLPLIWASTICNSDFWKAFVGSSCVLEYKCLILRIFSVSLLRKR